MVESQTPYRFMEKSLTDKSQCKKNSETKTSTLFFPIQNQWKKVWFWMSNTRDNNSGKIEGAYFGRVHVRSIFFWPNSYIMTFSKYKFQ